MIFRGKMLEYTRVVSVALQIGFIFACKSSSTTMVRTLGALTYDNDMTRTILLVRKRCKGLSDQKDKNLEENFRRFLLCCDDIYIA